MTKSVLTPASSQISQSPHLPAWASLTLCPTQSFSIFPQVDTSLGSGPAWWARQLVGTACLSTGGTRIPRDSLPALSPGSRPGSWAAHSAVEKPCSAPGWRGTFVTTDSSSCWASVTWDQDRFFSRYFLDKKAIVFPSVKSESLTKGWRHLSFLNKRLFQCLKSTVGSFPLLGEQLSYFGQTLNQKLRWDLTNGKSCKWLETNPCSEKQQTTLAEAPAY